MFKRLLFLVSVMLLIGAPSAFAGVGVFDYVEDIGGPEGIGFVMDEGYVWKEDPTLYQQYLVTAGGADVWGSWDQFNFAYKKMTGSVRVSLGMEWVAAADSWAKCGAELRASTAGDAQHYMTVNSQYQRGNDNTWVQWRDSTGAGSGSAGVGSPHAKRVGVQRVMVGAYPVIEYLADFGGGFESVGLQVGFGLPDEVLLGVLTCSHQANGLAQARVYDVVYEQDPSLVAELPVVSAGSAKPNGCETQIPGFMITTKKAAGSITGFDDMNALLDGIVAAADCPEYMAYPPEVPTPQMVTPPSTRIEQFVNLHDSSGRGEFADDQSFPCIDKLEQETTDPAHGDDDDNFATEVVGCIHLTAGAHIIGINSDDGAILTIGGMEIGRTEAGKGVSNVDFLFIVEQEDDYDLLVRHMEMGGGGALELHEVLADGTRILLNDVAAGGSPVFVPEPATIALLGLGGLALIRGRKRS